MRIRPSAPFRHAVHFGFAAALAVGSGAVLPATGRAPVRAQAVATEHEGAAALGLALRRLGTTKRVLMIGAHPDDENSAVLSALALGEGADVAYLSLTRGEGGQNLIGPELQEGLGIIRSEELLAARRLDGAGQFFTRAYDFGFSRSADEALSQWPRDSILSDVVAIVRDYRPDVLVSVFSGTPADGHGQHQVAGIMAREAFRFAGDPSVFPEQIVRGLLPHEPAYLLQVVWRPRGDEQVRRAIGDYDPLLGRSHYQVAMASRSRHRSQDMGQPEPIGPRDVAIAVLAGKYPGGTTSFFAGLDTTLSGRAFSAISQRSFTPPHVAALRRYEAEVERARQSFSPLARASVVPILAAARTELLRADSMLAAATASDALRREIGRERAQLEDALWIAAGLVLDAQADEPRVVPGQELTVTLTLWNGGTSAVGIETLEPALPRGWQATTRDPLATGPLEAGQLVRRRFTVRIAADADVTEPYYLRAPRRGDLYAWPDDDALRGRPFEPAQVAARALVFIDGHPVQRSAEVAHVEIDKASGERRVPVLVVPAVAVAVRPHVTVVPAPGAAADDGPSPDDAATRLIAVDLISEAPGPISGTLRLQVPEGWRADPASLQLRFDRPGERRESSFLLYPPASPAPGEHQLRAVFEAADGRAYDRGYTVIDYPHTRPRPLYRDAVTEVFVFAVAVPPGLRVGYIEGAGDDGATALGQLGVDVTQLDADAVARADLSRYDAIVLGIRAYETRQDLIAHNDRLLEYARRGGTVITQYNKYEYVDGGFAPFPLTMARPHGRVTDENAPVRMLDPSHPLLSWPNRITEADFTGWVQERGLYYADTWDDRYTPLLEMADPGEDALRGSLLMARVGDGAYVYTGLALFRQLPEGVPGAYRLLVNLVSLRRRPGS